MGPPGPAGEAANVDGLVAQINELKVEIEALKNKKLPDIPIELYDRDTGELIEPRWYVPLGEPIQLDLERGTK